MGAPDISCPSSAGSDVLPSLRAHNSLELQVITKKLKHSKLETKDRDGNDEKSFMRDMFDNLFQSGFDDLSISLGREKSTSTKWKKELSNETNVDKYQYQQDEGTIISDAILVGSNRDRGTERYKYGAAFLPLYVPFGEEEHNQKVFRSKHNKIKKSESSKPIEQDANSEINNKGMFKSFIKSIFRL